MNFEMENVKKTIENSKKILITSHTNCDQDGICSALATKLILEKHYQNKEIVVNIESQLQRNISFLKDFSKIQTENLFKKTKEFKPNLIIFTDGSSFSRFTSNHSELRKVIEKENIRTILIDHHKTENDFKFDFKYNNLRSSCAEETYHLFVREMKLQIDFDIAEVIITGMIFDTGVFRYQNSFFRETANVVADLVEMGINIEKILGFKNIYTKKDFEIFTELNKNLVLKDGYSYSFISDETFKKANPSQEEYKKAYHAWIDLFLRNIEKRPWGFVVRAEGEGKYSVTFRSQKGAQNVRILAQKLGGGGHDYASGATLQAKDINSVIEKIMALLL